MNKLSLGIVVALSTCANANAADINADGSTATNVISSPDGSIRVSIAPATPDGTSLNRFDEFGVGAKGAIIDNTLSKSKLIINEVTGSKKSSINGTIGVEGQRAAIIIANPNGISVNGGKFKNTNGIILSTGKITNQAGVQLGVTSGTLTIEGSGINTDSAALHIVSKDVLIDGAVDAGERALSIVSGTSDTDVSLMDSGAVELLSRSSGVAGLSGQPSIVISSGAIIKGGSIRLQALDAGAAISQDGNVVAGSFQLSSNGKITLAGSIEAAGAISVAGSEIVVGNLTTAKIKSTNSGVRIRSKSGDVTIRNSELSAVKRDTNSFAALGGVSIESARDLKIKSDNSAQNFISVTKDGAGLTARGAIVIDGAKISSGGKIIVSAGTALDVLALDIDANSVSMVSAADSTLKDVTMNSTNGVSIDAQSIKFSGVPDKQTKIKSQQEGITLISRKGDVYIENTTLDAAAVTAGDSANLAAITISSAREIILSSTAKSSATQFRTTTDGINFASLGGIAISNSTVNVGGDFTISTAGTFATRTNVHAGSGEQFSHSSGSFFGNGFKANIDYGSPIFEDFRSALLISGTLDVKAKQWENYGSIVEATSISAVVQDNLINQSILTGTAYFKRSCFFICSATGYSNTGLIESKIYASDRTSIIAEGTVLTTGAILASNLDLLITAKTFVANSTLTPNVVLHKSGIFGFSGLRDGWIGYGYDGGFVGSFFGNMNVAARSITYSGVTPYTGGELIQLVSPVIEDIPSQAQPLFNYRTGYLSGILN